MARILRFEFNVTIDDLDLGELEGVSMDTFSEKIREAVKNLSESLDLRLEYGKVFDLDQRTGFYSKTLLDMSEAMDNAKIIEIDNENKKLAIVLNGKDDVIDIFDASPYVDYNPFEYITKEDQNQNNINNNKTKGVVQIEEQGNNLDVNQIFDEIKNYKNIRFQKDSEENQDINRDSKSALIEN